MRPWLMSLSMLLTWVAVLPAQPTDENGSTGQEGQLLPSPFRVFAATGSRAQHFHCFFTERDLNPSVAIIALRLPANPQDPLAVLLQKLNALTEARKEAKLGAFAIFLTLDKEFYEDPARIQRLADMEGLGKQLNLTELALGLSFPDAQPVKQYGIISRRDPVADPNNMIKPHLVTVLVYDKHRVRKRFTFTDDRKLDDEAIQQIFAAVEAMLPESK